MANEIRGVSPSGTLYARIMNSAGKIWNGSSFETYSASNYSTYDIAMTEQGNSSVYCADFPSAITTGGTYEYYVHRQSGGSPAEGDIVVTTGKIDWTGTVSITTASGAMTGSDWRDYLLRLGFKRTDKDAELYEATTDAIQEMRRRFMFDEAELDTTTTDTLATSGEFKIDIESDFGMVLDVVMQDGTDAKPLTRIPKWRFDELYPDINVTNDRGYPDHYCIYGGQIYVGPIPDKTSYIFRICHSQRAGTITSSTTAVPFTNIYRDILANNVLFRLYMMLDEQEKASGYKQLYEEGFDQAIRRERINSGSTIWTQQGFYL